MFFRLGWLSLAGTNSLHIFFFIPFSKVPANTSPNPAIGGRKGENSRARWWGCFKIHNSMLFIWLGALSFSFNKLSPKAYLPNEYYLLNFLQAPMQKQVSWFNYQLWRREGTWNSIEIYSSFFSLDSFALTKIPVQRTDWLSCDLKKDKIMWQESNNGIIVHWTEYICTVISDG